MKHNYKKPTLIAGSSIISLDFYKPVHIKSWYDKIVPRKIGEGQSVKLIRPFR